MAAALFDSGNLLCRLWRREPVLPVAIAWQAAIRVCPACSAILPEESAGVVLLNILPGRTSPLRVGPGEEYNGQALLGHRLKPYLLNFPRDQSEKALKTPPCPY